MGNEPQGDGGEEVGDLIERNAGGGLETGDAYLKGTQERAEFSEADPPRSEETTNADAVEEAAAEAAAMASIDEKIGTAFDRSAVKRSNFSRLASKRVSGVLERLSVLKQLSNTNTYEWTQDQHDRIFNAIDEQLKEVRKAFEAAKKPKVRDRSQLRFEV